MTRNRERRSFTVAAKSSGHQGFVSIPAKAPRAAARKPLVQSPWQARPTLQAAPSNEAETRRILPSLIAWEISAPEPEPDFTREPPLPRVRRVTPQGAIEDAPRRRGRPRKTPLIELPVAAVARKPDPAPVIPVPQIAPFAVAPTTKLAPRRIRPENEELRRGERWKRRLPRSCW